MMLSQWMTDAVAIIIFACLFLYLRYLDFESGIKANVRLIFCAIMLTIVMISRHKYL